MKTKKIIQLKEIFSEFYKNKERLATTNNFTNNSLTFGDILSNIHERRENLSNQLTNESDKVVLYDLPGEEWVINFWAIVSLGKIVVPIDTRLDESAMKSAIEKIKPKFIITHNENSFGLKKLPNINFDKKSQKFEKLFDLEIDQSKPAIIALTSGSWSSPKGAVLSLNNIFSNMSAIMEVHSPQKDDKFLSILPLAHMYELTVGMLIPLFKGCHIFYLDEVIGSKIISEIKKNQITYIVGVPRILELFKKGIIKKIKKGSISNLIFNIAIFSRVFPINFRKKIFKFIRKGFGTSLHTITVGGAALNPDLDKLFQGLGYKILIGYGLTETSPVISISTDQNRQPKEVGQVMSNLDLKISNDGEVIVSGPSLFLGYYPQISKPNEFMTGDLGKLENDKLFLTGRKKNLLVYPNGDKIYLEDIEEIINKHSDVEESAAIELENNEIDLVVYPKNKNIKLKETDLTKNLPLFVKVRNLIITHQELPKTHTMKLKRGEIKNIS